MNGDIRDREIRVIASSGEMLGVMTPREALRLAEDENLDLVKISPNAVPPVCKIMDYGKFKIHSLSTSQIVTSKPKKKRKTVKIKKSSN